MTRPLTPDESLDASGLVLRCVAEREIERWRRLAMLWRASSMMWGGLYSAAKRDLDKQAIRCDTLGRESATIESAAGDEPGRKAGEPQGEK